MCGGVALLKDSFNRMRCLLCYRDSHIQDLFSYFSFLLLNWLLKTGPRLETPILSTQGKVLEYEVRLVGAVNGRQETM